MFLRRSFLVAAACAFAAAPLLAGCDAADPDGADTPGVIAASSFRFDSSFPTQGGALAGGDAAKIGANYLNAWGRFNVVTAVVGLNLLVPAEATRVAGQAEPTVEAGTWVWANSTVVNGQTIDVRLEGTPEGTEVDWEMFVSGTVNGRTYDDFVLYDGTTSLDGRDGSWRLFYDIDGARTHVLSADFAVASETAREVTFSVPQTHPDASARGASVYYEADGDARVFDWHEATAGQTHYIAWSAPTGEGSITAWNYLDGERACWNTFAEGLNDVACAD